MPKLCLRSKVPSKFLSFLIAPSKIRCVVSVLFRVASGRDPAIVVRDLLDIEAHPRRPQYPMASEIPLSLSSCDYENNELDWNYDSEAVLVTLKQLQELWAEHSIKATMFKGNNTTVNNT